VFVNNNSELKGTSQKTAWWMESKAKWS